MSVLYLAAGGFPQIKERGLHWHKGRASLLLTFYGITKNDLAMLEYARFSMLDSGAFSAYTKGVTIDHDALIRFAKTMPFNEVVALDVIGGDWRQTLENARKMVAAGVPAMPVFHYGEPFEALRAYCSEFPKVGLAWSILRNKQKGFAWIAECFDREWPHLFHSFGRTNKDLLFAFPFDSADSSGPLIASCFGQQAKTRKTLRVVKHAYFGLQLKLWLEFEAMLAARWQAELEPLRAKFNPRGWRK